MSQVQRALAAGAATLALALALWVLVPRLLGASDPEGEVLTALKALERQAPPGPLSFGVLHPRQLQYQRMGVSLLPSGEAAWVTATLDLVGAVERPGDAARTEVSSLGLERIPFERRGGGWVAVEGGWPRLAAALELLEQRRRATEAKVEPGVARRRLQARAWYLRSEREAVAVAEDFRLQEDGPSRPRDELGTSRFELRALSDGGLEVSR
jgi:hypothetical protein